MLIVLTSREAVAPNGNPRADVVASLLAAAQAGNPTAIVSNQPAEPSWFAPSFGASGVRYVAARGRQDGKIVPYNAQRFGLQPYDTLVLAATREDVQMSKNGGAVLVPAGWSNDSYVQSLGVDVATAADFDEVLKLAASWPGGWYFEGKQPLYSIASLSDLSSKYTSLTQEQFSHRVVSVVKQGGPKLMSLLTTTARSLLVAQVHKQRNLMWGVYPGSASANNDSEVLSDFVHRLRTTVSSVRMAERGKPLFIRHVQSTKRSRGGGGLQRENPAEQIETIHLNPAYQGKIYGRNVVVLDDCVTYGVSFAVAAALLRKAGAASTTAIALGKFGNTLRYYDIDIQASPFAPIAAGQYVVRPQGAFGGATDAAAQNALRGLIT